MLYPNLNKMTLDLLSIHAIADAERLFSSTKPTISNRRNRLGIDLIQVLECLKSWMGLSNWVEDEIEMESEASLYFL
jgi:hypothetical protein